MACEPGAVAVFAAGRRLVIPDDENILRTRDFPFALVIVLGHIGDDAAGGVARATPSVDPVFRTLVLDEFLVCGSRGQGGVGHGVAILLGFRGPDDSIGIRIFETHRSHGGTGLLDVRLKRFPRLDQDLLAYTCSGERERETLG